MNTKKVNEYFLKSPLAKEKVMDTVLLDGDASTRQYYRVRTKDRSYIVCIQNDSEKEKMSDFKNVQNIFQGAGVLVPKIYHSDLDLGYFILEDLGDVTLLKKLARMEDEERERSFYKMVLEQLLKIHSIDEVFQRAFDLDKLMEEVAFSLKYLLRETLAYSLKKEDEKVLLSSYETICKKITQADRVLSHRDFHSRNLMFHKDSFFTIDFQDAMMGVPQYDLVSLLDDCYYEVSDDNKAFLKKYYFDHSHGYAGDFEHFLELYDYVKMQRLFKALGSFGYIHQTKKDNRYLKYIGYGFENLRATLKKYPKFDPLRRLIGKAYYES